MKSANKKAVVTGATGYIGSKLVQHLLREGWAVHVFTRRPEVLRGTKHISKEEIHLYDGSRNSVSDGIRAANPEVVFHLASMFAAEHRSDQIDDLVTSNVLFGTQLIDVCAEVGVKKFINTGTSWQHYRSDKYDPVCLYAATKQAFEDILDFYADAYQMQIATLKLFDVYGPDDPRPKLINLLLRALKTGERLEMSPGEQLLDLVHVDDVTSAYTSCANYLDEITKSGKHLRVAISSGEALSVRELVKVLSELSGRLFNGTFGARQYRQREVMTPWRDKIKVTWWRPQISLKEGLTKAWREFGGLDKAI
jgi:nucleoside-diphosphate-sugar epimerase